MASAGDGQVDLSWDAVAGAASYNVYWSTSPGVTTASGTQIAGAWNPRWKQTPAEATEAGLAAAPSYFNQGAFTTLFGASYPFSLPYSAGLDELRTYLGQLGLPLWQLRQALLPLVGATTAQQAEVAAERFRLPPHAAGLIANAGSVPTEVAWGTPAPPADPVAYLAGVSELLQAASITYESLLELLEVSWVQGGKGVAIVNPGATCSTAAMSLSGLDAPFLDRAHRFLRLWAATGFKMWELDLLLSAAAVGNGNLDQATLAALLSFELLRDATKLSVDQQLAFYQDIDTSAHRDPGGSTTASLYAQVFLSANPVAPDPDLSALAVGGPVANPTLRDHLAAVQPALGVSASDAATLFGLTNNQLTLANLSFVYRANLLASAQLPVASLVALAQLLDPSAASASDAVAALFASPAATLQFLQQTKAVKTSALSLDTLTYLAHPTQRGAWGAMADNEPDERGRHLRCARCGPTGRSGDDGRRPERRRDRCHGRERPQSWRVSPCQ